MKIHNQVAEKVSARSSYIADKFMETYYEQYPQVKKHYGASEHGKAIQDLKYHFTYLKEAIKLESPNLFDQYMLWVKELFVGLGISDHLVPSLEIMKAVFTKEFTSEESQIIVIYLDSALDKISNSSFITDSYLRSGNVLGELTEKYLQALLAADKQQASRLILDAVESGESIKSIYKYVFETTQYEIGRLWQVNKISVAQEHYCTAVTQSVMAQLYPYIFSAHADNKKANFVATSISGELHELGIRMVCDFMEMDGWNTYYLGANMPIQGIIGALKEREAQVLAIATTMTFHLTETEKLVDAIRKDSEVKDIKIILGGRPFNQQPDLWKKFAVDGYCQDAEGVIHVANALVTGGKDHD